MSFESEDDRLMLDYLLGRLGEEEDLRLEERYFQDDSLLERLEFLEDRLVDEYVNGELSQEDRGAYESRFIASPRRLEKARLGQGLRRASVAAERKQRAPLWGFLKQPYFRTLVFASVSLVLAAGGWLTIQSRSEQSRLRGSLETLTKQLADSRAGQRQLAGALEKLQSAARAPAGARALPVIAFVLQPGLTRGGPGTGRLRIPRGDVRVSFQLKLPERVDQSPFLVSLRTAEGDVLWSEEAARSNDGALSVSIPGAILPEGDFLFTVEAELAGSWQRIASYHVAVLRQ